MWTLINILRDLGYNVDLAHVRLSDASVSYRVGYAISRIDGDTTPYAVNVLCAVAGRVASFL